MLTWLLLRLDKMERIRAVARALMEEFGDKAYAEARRRECDARRRQAADDWRRVALVVARWTPRGAPSDTKAPTLPEAISAEVILEPLRTFRIQFVCETVEPGPTDLTEREIEAADAPAAIIAAAGIKWPPRTIGVRILDREGHEVFARQKARPSMKTIDMAEPEGAEPAFPP
jgi:hypothetical protein